MANEEPQVQPVSTEPDEPSTTTSKNDSSAWIGGIVWVVIIAAVVYFKFFPGGADILLNVSTNTPVTVSGVVTLDGTPLSGGSLQVAMDDPRDGRRLTSSMASINPMGEFHAEFADPALAGKELKVTAQFFGKTAEKESKGVSGSSTIYVNMTPPWSPGWSALIVIIPLIVLVVLFTGPLPPRKARLLFGVTYVITFAACIIPVVLTVAVSQSQYLLKMMEAAPIGIVKAEKGVDKAQWLLNIGGAIIPPPTVAKSQTPAPATDNKNGKQPAAADTAAVVQTDPQAAAASVAAAPKGPTPGTAAAANPDTSGNEPQFPRVQAGLAIPLYVLILSMFGGAINMTRKVPAIQNTYDSSAAATPRGALAAPIAFLGMAKPAAAPETLDGTKAAAIRRELIETYLYFLSAPFLVIAVYYLLQVLANSVAEPVLVVIAFATGLMSDATVGTIMNFADSTLKKIKTERDSREAEDEDKAAKGAHA